VTQPDLADRTGCAMEVEMTDRQPDLLRGLAPDDAAGVMALGSRQVLPGGSTLFHLGDAANSLYLVARGRVNLTLPMQIGGRDEDILVEERLPGQMLGWSALIPPHRFTLNATAPFETELIALPREALLDHFRARPQVGYAVVSNLAEVIGQRLQVLQAMWLREMQRVIQFRCA